MLVDSPSNRSLKKNGTNSADTIIGTFGNDQIFGFAADDMLFGGRGDDCLYGMTGDDRLYGMEGDDSLDGGDGNDSLQGGAGNDTLTGGNGNDDLRGDDGNDRLYENAGNNKLWGFEGNDSFILTGGNNIASGGNGDDSFSVGGRQNSILAGGVGYDRYVFGQIIDGDAKPSALPTGIIFIREIFNDRNWGSIELSSLNLEWINPKTGKTPSGSANTAKNDVWASQVGTDIIYDIKYNDGGSLKIILDDASSVANTIGSHVIFSTPR